MLWRLVEFPMWYFFICFANGTFYMAISYNHLSKIISINYLVYWIHILSCSSSIIRCFFYTVSFAKTKYYHVSNHIACEKCISKQILLRRQCCITPPNMKLGQLSNYLYFSTVLENSNQSVPNTSILWYLFLPFPTNVDSWSFTCFTIVLYKMLNLYSYQICE